MAISTDWQKLETAIPDTEKAYGNAEQIIGSLPALISKVYDALKSAGRERDAYALSDAADRFSRTAGGLGVNAFSRSQALFDLQSRLGAAADLREAGLSENELNQLKGAQQAIAQIGVDKAQALFSQKSQVFNAAQSEKSANRAQMPYSNMMALKNEAMANASFDQAKAMGEQSSAEADARQRAMAGRSTDIRSAYTGSQPNTDAQIQALAAEYVRSGNQAGRGLAGTNTGQTNINPADAYTLARNAGLNKGTGGSWGVVTTPQPQQPTVTPMGQAAQQPGSVPIPLGGGEGVSAPPSAPMSTPGSVGVDLRQPNKGTGIAVTSGGQIETIGTPYTNQLPVNSVAQKKLAVAQPLPTGGASMLADAWTNIKNRASDSVFNKIGNWWYGN